VLFDRTLFPELLAVTGDQGGRAVIARHGDEVERVEVGEAAALLDVDTRRDYERAVEETC
jgi:molybdenum cofactor cytidylyltransferase